MSLLQTINTAISSLGANKLRAGLALLGIVIGVTAVITLMSIGRGTTEQITGIIQGLGTNLLFVQPEGDGQLTLGDSDALVDPVYAPTVLAAAPEIRSFATLAAGRENTFAQVVGVTPDYLTARNLDLASGMFIKFPHVDNRDEVIVLGSIVAEQLFQNRDPVGEYVRVNARRYRVIGLLESQGGGGFGTFDTQVLIPITTAYYRLSSERTATGDVTQSTSSTSRSGTWRTSTGVSRRRAECSAYATASPRRTTSPSSASRARSKRWKRRRTPWLCSLGIIAGISLLVGGIGIMNIMLVSVTERTREIGIRKAMGAKRRDILFQFVAEATALSIGGGLLGAGLGFWMTSVVDGRTLGSQTFNASFSNEFAALALIVSAGIGLFFGIYPAVRASRLHPIDALRYE